MAHHKSAKKRIKTNERDRKRNLRYRKLLKKVVRAALEETKKSDAEGKVKEAVSVIDKAVSKGLMHKKSAARKKSRVTRRLNAMA